MVSCLKVEKIISKGKEYYIAHCFSSYNFLFRLFITKELFEQFTKVINEKGFVDITNLTELVYNEKQGKLVYVIKKN